MSNVKGLVGLEFKPFRFEIEKGKIKEFASAIGDENPIYYDIEAAQEQGFEGIPIPLTFLQAVDFWGGTSFQEKMEKLKINPVKALHGGKEFEFFHDIYAGDVLTVTSKVISVDIKQGSTGWMDFITTENRYINQDDVLVAISNHITIQRH